ncbi:MAG TPA: superoxide dismutase family protein [Chitinophagaceae bacterium]
MKKNAQLLRSALLAIGFSATVAACSNNAEESGTTADTAGTATADTAGTTATSTAAGPAAEATLSGVYSDTAVSGTARFTQGASGQVKLNLEVTVPAKANGTVAVHLHEMGSCADNGKAAGPHWNPTGEAHGKWGEGAYHSGDLGNVTLDGSGRGTLELESDRWSIGGDAQKDILNKAVIVHSGVDDYKSQPAGNAGNRIGCGVIAARNNP